MEYRHTQTGYTAFLVAIFLLAIVVIVATATDEEPLAAVIVGIVAALVLLIVFVFNRLTTTVSGGAVKVAFGAGWPRRTIDVLDIAGFTRVRNKWYYGWGIRLVPGGWMYNVWGLDAVEIEMKSGKKFRIGTDEPDDLIAALALHTSIQPT